MAKTKTNSVKIDTKKYLHLQDRYYSGKLTTQQDLTKQQQQAELPLNTSTSKQ